MGLSPDRFSVCIEVIFFEVPFLERIAMVKELGLPFVEFWRWGNKDIAGIKHEIQRHGLSVRMFALDSSDPTTAECFANRDRGILVNPAVRKSFLTGLQDSIQVAHELGCTMLCATSGNEQKHISREEQHQSIVDGLKEAAPILEKEKILLVLEPVNSLVNHPGIYLAKASEGFEIVKKVNSPCVKILYDVSHQQIMEGNLISTIQNNIDWIGHFHINDVPGRKEPGHGEIHFPNLFKAIVDANYTGSLGLEYKPTHSPSRKAVEYCLKCALISLPVNK